MKTPEMWQTIDMFPALAYNMTYLEGDPSEEAFHSLLIGSSANFPLRQDLGEGYFACILFDLCVYQGLLEALLYVLSAKHTHCGKMAAPVLLQLYQRKGAGRRIFVYGQRGQEPKKLF